VPFSIFQEIYKVIQEEEYFCYTLSQKIHIHHIQSPSKVGSLLWLIKLPQSPRSQKLWRSNPNKTGHNLPNKINLYTHMYLVIQGRQWMELEGHEFTKLWTQKWSQVKCLHSLSFKYTPLKPPSCTWSRESVAQHISTRFQRKLHNNALKVCHLVNSLHTNTCTAHEWVWFVITKHQTIAIIRIIAAVTAHSLHLLPMMGCKFTYSNLVEFQANKNTKICILSFCCISRSNWKTHTWCWLAEI
jgi:hypothetical protein